MRAVIFFSADLMFGSRVQSVADSIGLELHSVRNLNQLKTAIGEVAQTARVGPLLLVDLECPQADVQTVMDAASSLTPDTRIVGYAGHVRTELLESAREAGFQDVLSKGQFNSQMRDLLSDP